MLKAYQMSSCSSFLTHRQQVGHGKKSQAYTAYIILAPHATPAMDIGDVFVDVQKKEVGFIDRNRNRVVWNDGREVLFPNNRWQQHFLGWRSRERAEHCFGWFTKKQRDPSQNVESGIQTLVYLLQRKGYDLVSRISQNPEPYFETEPLRQCGSSTFQQHSRSGSPMDISPPNTPPLLPAPTFPEQNNLTPTGPKPPFDVSMTSPSSPSVNAQPTLGSNSAELMDDLDFDSCLKEALGKEFPSDVSVLEWFSGLLTPEPFVTAA